MMRGSADDVGIGKRLVHARQERGMTLRALAPKAQISASLLSQIENGKSNPSVMTLMNIAMALGLPVRYFFPADDDQEANTTEEVPESGDENTNGGPPNTIASFVAQLSGEGPVDLPEDDTTTVDPEILRPDDRAVIELMEGVRWARLTPAREKGVEFMDVTYPVGVSSGPTFMRHAGREFILVQEGKFLIEITFEHHTLCKDDSIIFDSTTPHRITNVGNVEARALWVIFDRP